MEVALAARRTAVTMVSKARAAHIGSSLSMIDILSVIYAELANVSANPEDPKRDMVFVSKGHAAAGTYAVMHHVGLIPQEWIDAYCEDGAQLGGHVTSHGVPGVELSTGSLGHALPVAVGVMLAAKRAGSDRRAWVLLSDGECDEGSNWEAALLVGHLGLSNLTVVIDRNGLQSLTTTEKTVRLEPLADKWAAFGWDVVEIDGHDHEVLGRELSASGDRPRCVIARTTKGKGVGYMENEVLWHYRPPNDEELAVALSDLKGD